MSEQREGSREFRTGIVTGSPRGVRKEAGSSTAPADNLVAIMRDATIVVDAGIRRAETLYVPAKPQPIGRVEATGAGRGEPGSIG